jgi:hypothetical protein
LKNLELAHYVDRLQDENDVEKNDGLVVGA